LVLWLCFEAKNHNPALSLNLLLVLPLRFLYKWSLAFGIKMGAYTPWCSTLFSELSCCLFVCLFWALHQPCFILGIFKIESHKLFAQTEFELWCSWSLPAK
jgi:hypothetical protein